MRYSLPSSMILSGAIALLNVACSESPGNPPGSELHVPEGYTVEVAAGPEMVDFPMFATLDENGRLFVFESIGNVYQKSQEAIDHPQFRIKLLQDADGDGRYDKSTVFADKLSFPQGGVFYKGSLYVSSAPDLLKLTDTDGDGVADKREVLLSGWILNVNANSLIGPFMGPDGWLYMTNAIMGFDVTSKEGVRMKGETARIWRVRPDGSQLEWVSAGGMNNPVELTFTDAAEVIGTQTFFVDPQRGLRDALTFWVEGGVYGKKNSNITRDKLPLTGDLMPVVAQYSRVAPAGLGAYRSEVFGEAFRDNLFSAQFNTHSVIRHQLLREDASFRTEDERFLWSENEDFHPTDVLEDADGSLLVVETGGWFILGCPLSRVSKPQLKGSIYRIRRKGADDVKDPYGNTIAWASLSPPQMTALLEDPRPFVADRAVESIVNQGSDAIPALKEVLEKSVSADVRTRAVFALYRIGGEATLTAMRDALMDSDLQVRIAAARVCGLARNPWSVDQLLRMVREDEPAVQRQAATALGQIGDSRAIPVLLETAAKTDDRFIRHALIYALIILRQPDLVFPALQHLSPKTREAALIALDQMQESPLLAHHLIPFLQEEYPSLQQTALWVASHHPEWSPAMTAYLDSRLSGPPPGEEEKLLLSAILTSFCGHPDMQSFMARQMNSRSPETRLFILDNMANCEEKMFPDEWINLFRDLLITPGDHTVKLKTVKLIRLRGIKSLEESLFRVAGDINHPSELRIEAIGALLGVNPKLGADYFTYLFDELFKNEEAPVLQQIAGVLATADLSEDQLLKIAQDYLPQAEPFILPRITAIFEGTNNVEVGKALVAQLMNSPSLDSFTEENIHLLFSGYPSELKPLVNELLARLKQAHGERLQRLEKLEALIASGSIEKGRDLYFGKAICWTCHTMGEEGGNLGPDLTSIQHDRSVHDILEALIYPSVSFVREYETYDITTLSGQHRGIIKDQTPEAILLATGPQSSIRIAREEITHISQADVSLMPPGLEQLLTEQEFADLIAYLLGQDLVY